MSRHESDADFGLLFMRYSLKNKTKNPNKQKNLQETKQLKCSQYTRQGYHKEQPVTIASNNYPMSKHKRETQIQREREWEPCQVMKWRSSFFAALCCITAHTFAAIWPGCCPVLVTVSFWWTNRALTASSSYFEPCSTSRTQSAGVWQSEWVHNGHAYSLHQKVQFKNC